MSMHDDIKTVLVSEEELKAKVAELGAQISKDYEGKNLVLVSILKGSDAARKIRFPILVLRKRSRNRHQIQTALQIRRTNLSRIQIK